MPNPIKSFSIVMLLAAFGTACTAYAQDCTLSKTFTLKRAQHLSGTLKDPLKAPLPGMRVELIQKGKTVSSQVADNDGAYDFGDVSPGKYNIRVRQSNSGSPFCAPSVKCGQTGCQIQSILKLGPQMTTVM